jgi:hypothetical protein
MKNLMNFEKSIILRFLKSKVFSVVLLITVLLLLINILIATNISNISNELKDQVELMRNDGMTFSWTELYPETIEKKDNAAPLYEAAVNLLVLDKEVGRDIFSQNTQVDEFYEKDRDMAVKILDDNNISIQLFREASKKTGYEIPYTQMDLYRRRLNAFDERGLFFLVTLKAYHNLKNGYKEEAAELLTDQLKMLQLIKPLNFIDFAIKMRIIDRYISQLEVFTENRIETDYSKLIRELDHIVEILPEAMLTSYKAEVITASLFFTKGHEAENLFAYYFNTITHSDPHLLSNIDKLKLRLSCILGKKILIKDQLNYYRIAHRQYKALKNNEAVKLTDNEILENQKHYISNVLNLNLERGVSLREDLLDKLAGIREKLVELDTSAGTTKSL